MGLLQRIKGFIGSAFRLHATAVDAEDTINFYVELTPGADSIVIDGAYLHHTPGVRPFVVTDTAIGSSATGGVRGEFQQDGRAFAVSGTRFYEVLGSRTMNAQGVVVDDGQPVTFATNGTAGDQLALASGGHLYVFTLSTNTFAEVTDPDLITPVAMVAFCDGYGIVLKQHSRQFQISALEDFTDYDGLDIAEISEASDDVLALFVLHREITLIGSKTKQSWSDIGDPSFPFAPVPGSLQQTGIAAPFAWAVRGNTALWLGASEGGSGTVYLSAGYAGQRVSTHAVEEDLADMPRLSDVEAWSYDEQGHVFFVLYFPSSVTGRRNSWHWVYDVTTGQWHKRARWDSVRMCWTPDVGRCHMFAFGQHLVGSRLNAAIYEQRLDLYANTIVTRIA